MVICSDDYPKVLFIQQSRYLPVFFYDRRRYRTGMLYLMAVTLWPTLK
ncbi:hypothetical protein [Candidatus Symbiopectobacterium sp.]|nr:hypothetical protein [Candidatus Symbiopectobacterium sp.]